MPIQIHLLAGRQKGRRIVMRTSPITVGRDPSCDIVIEDSVVSRRQLRLEEVPGGDWQIVNESEQGTTCGWRRITNQPKPVRGTLKLSASSLPLLEVTAITDEQSSGVASTSDALSSEAAAEAKASSGRTKLWVGIGVFWLVVIVLGVLFSTLAEGTKATQEIEQLSEAEIVAEIYQQPERSDLAADPRQVAVHLAEANRNYEMRDRTSEALYRCYVAYRNGLSHTPDLLFEDGADQRRYQIVQEMLARELAARYRAAEGRYIGGEYQVAIERLRDLQSFYPVSQRTRVGRKIEELLNSAIEKNDN